jgi:transposase-like protein
MGRPAKAIICPRCKSDDIEKEKITQRNMSCVCRNCTCDFERREDYKIKVVSDGRDNPMDCLTYFEDNKNIINIQED